jgi:hypothetical protein
LEAATALFCKEFAALCRADAAAVGQLAAILHYHLLVADSDLPKEADVAHLLEQLCGMEGEFALPALEISLVDALCLRILRHRLRRLSLPATDIWSGLVTLAGYLETRDLGSVADLTGDVDALARALLVHLPTPIAGLVLFRCADVPVGHLQLQGPSDAFCLTLSDHLSAAEYAAFAQAILDPLARREGHHSWPSQLEVWAGEPRQILLRHLLCLRLWLDGLVEPSALDTFATDEVSAAQLEALGQLCGLHALDAGAAARSCLMGHLQDGYWLLDAIAFWEGLCAPSQGQADGEGFRDLLVALGWSDGDGVDADSPGLLSALGDRLVTHASALNAGDLAGGTPPSRGTFRLLGLVRPQVATTGAALEHLLLQVNGGVHGVTLALKGHFDRLQSSISFLMSPPVLRSETDGMVIQTQFGPGFSPVTWVPQGVSAEALDAHGKMVSHIIGQVIGNFGLGF